MIFLTEKEPIISVKIKMTSNTQTFDSKGRDYISGREGGWILFGKPPSFSLDKRVSKEASWAPS